MIDIENVFCIHCQITDPVTKKEVKSQTILSYQVNSKEFYNKKTEKLLKQISQSDG